MRKTITIGIAFVLVAMVFASVPMNIASAATGDNLRTIAPSPSGNGRAVAFDGSNMLYYTLYPDTNMYKISTSGGATTTLPVGINMAALEWDPTRNMLWGGSYDGAGNIYLITPAGVPTFQFAINTFTNYRPGPYPGYIDGIEYDPATDSLWISEDLDTRIYHVTSGGVELGFFDVSIENSGIAFDGTYLWLADPHKNLVYQYTPGGFATGLSFSGIKTEGIDYDPVTFAPKCALWENQASSTANNLVAYEIPCPEVPVELYAGGSNPGKVYKYLGGTSWNVISPSLGYAVLDIVEYDGDLYAATMSTSSPTSGIGRVYRYDGGTTWTLVGDDMDDQVCALAVYQGHLYAGTAWGAMNLYRYDGGTTWTQVVNYTPWSGTRSLKVSRGYLLLGDIGLDRFGRWDGSTFNADLSGGGCCIYDYQDYGDYVYASAYNGRMWGSSDAINWNVVLGYGDGLGNMWELETYNDLLHMSYNNGELSASDGTTRGSVVYTAPDGITSMTTAEGNLYFGTGGEAGAYYGSETTGTAEVYKYDGTSVELISGSDEMVTGVQVLYQPPGTLYAGGSNPGKVYEYTGGTSWDVISPDLGYAVLDLVEYDGHLYAGIKSSTISPVGKVYRYDGGTTWTLVGNNLDNQVCSLAVYQGDLYAGTGWYGMKLYKYNNPGWTQVISPVVWSGTRALHVSHGYLLMGELGYDRFGRWDGTTFYQDQPSATGSCIYDYEDYKDKVYASAYSGRLWESPDATTWSVLLGYYDGHMWELEEFQSELYMSYHNGELRKSNVPDRGSLVYTAPDAIISMTTKGNYLFFGTGGESGYYSETTGTANVYKYDGTSVKLISGNDEMVTGVQVLYHVTNLAPFADADGPYVGDEGSGITFDASSSSDHEGDDLVYRWNIDGGWTSWSSSTTTSYTWYDDYSGTVTVEVTDGEYISTDTATVTVNNVAPTVTASGDTIVENGVATVSGTITDPGTLDTFTVVIDWGEGSPQTYNYGAGTTSFSETHQYLDDNPTGTSSDIYTIGVTVTDDDNGVGSASTTNTVNNVAPTASIDSVEPPFSGFILPGDEIDFYGSFTDPGTEDTHTIEWNFGDSSTETGTLTPTHAYTTAGTYTVTLTVTDDDTGVGTDTTTVTVISAEDAAGEIDDYIQNLPDEAFKDPAEQRKNALHEKLIENEEGDAVVQLIEASLYQEALEKLQNDIRPKMDGDSTTEDWIIAGYAQDDLMAMIDWLIGYLETLI